MRTRRLLCTGALTLLTLLPLSASAQQVTPTDGIRLPDASVATQSDAAALEVNPAGLGFMKGAEFGYGFNLATEDLRGVADEAQSYFLAGGLGGLGIGLAAQWLQKPELGADLQSYRKFTIASGAGFGNLGVGVGLNFLGSSDDERLDGLVGVDAGLQFRASEHLGFGLMLRDANTPFVREDFALPVRLDFGVALRFWDGRIVFEQGANLNLRDTYVALVPRLSVEAIDGFRIFGRAEFGAVVTRQSVRSSWDGLFAGLELSLGSLGAQYAARTQRFDPNESPRFSGISAYHWISPGKKAPLVDPTGRWIMLAMDAPVAEEPASSLFGTSTRSFLSVVRELERIADSDDVTGVVLTVNDLDYGYSQVWELRQSIARVRRSGKKTVVVLGTSSLREYYLASAAEEIWYVPSDVFAPNGIGSRFMSVSRAFRKLGVEAQFVRIGDYKSAPEMFVADDATPANVEQREAYIEAMWSRIITEIAKDRGKSPAELRKLFEEAHYPPDAVEAGLVDQLVYVDEVEDKLREISGGVNLERGFQLASYPDREWGRDDEVAVVAIEGSIIGGVSNPAPFFGDAVAGAASLEKTFERLEKDSRVRAVVVRIDSPGGSALASDRIYRAMRNVARRKPVVASLGNVAASGGYYVAAGADHIFAGPITTTGSIGIYGGKVNIEKLADRLGVETSTVERGQRISFTNFWSPWNEDELAALGKSLNYMYRLFLTQAAYTRPLSADELDEVARGRVWVGTAAKEHRLVDELGGLIAAVRKAESLAGMEPGEARVRQYTSASSGVLDVGLSGHVADWLGLGEKDTAHRLVNPASMVGALLRELAFAWSIPLLYEPGEALMLPFEWFAVD